MNLPSQKYVFTIILTAHECTINAGFKTGCFMRKKGPIPLSTLTDSQTLEQVSIKSARVQGFPTVHSMQIHSSVEGITHRS